MKEEIAQLKEESMLKTEHLEKHERNNRQAQKEVSFYKTQNNDLMKRLEECEKSLNMGSEQSN
jgi:hypothetical protein